MEEPLFRKFFTRPTNPYQRRYEALRAVYIDGQSQKQTAERFGFRYSTMRQLMYEFRKQQMEADSQSPFFAK
jgi:DNA-directed RNA polymerase specialized sigma24 family protein